MHASIIDRINDSHYTVKKFHSFSAFRLLLPLGLTEAQAPIRKSVERAKRGITGILFFADQDHCVYEVHSYTIPNSPVRPLYRQDFGCHVGILGVEIIEAIYSNARYAKGICMESARFQERFRTTIRLQGTFSVEEVRHAIGSHASLVQGGVAFNLGWERFSGLKEDIGEVAQIHFSEENIETVCKFLREFLRVTTFMLEHQDEQGTLWSLPLVNKA